MSTQKALRDGSGGTGLRGKLSWNKGTRRFSEVTGLPITHFIAAAGVISAVPLRPAGNYNTRAGIDLTLSMHWPNPVVTGSFEDDADPEGDGWI